MKVLQINCVYDYGSTGKLTKAIHQGLLRQGEESVVLYGRRQPVREAQVYKTCTELEAKAWNVLSRFTGRPYAAAPLGTAALLRALRRERPDVVHLQCINGFFVNIYTLVGWLKEHQIPTVLTLHADFMFTGGCSSAVDCDQWSLPQGCGSSPCPYFQRSLIGWKGNPSGALWKRMKSAFEGFDEGLVVVCVSPWLKERAERAPILMGKRHQVILNGLDTNVFRVWDGQSLRLAHHCQSRRVILHVTPQFSGDKQHLKGGYYVLELARRLPDMVFMVAGKTQGEISAPENVIFLGMITDQQLLARYYSMADTTLLTSRAETFSMVCAESLCCGTPVIGFKAGGPEQIAIKEYSRFFEYGDLAALENGLRQESPYSKTEIAEKARERYAQSSMVSQYIALYQTLLDHRSPQRED